MVKQVATIRVRKRSPEIKFKLLLSFSDRMNIGIGVGNAVDQILWDLLDRTPSKAFLAIVDLPTLEEQEWERRRSTVNTVKGLEEKFKNETSSKRDRSTGALQSKLTSQGDAADMARASLCKASEFRVWVRTKQPYSYAILFVV
ncbi:MAG: hypothetical protein FRX48_03959 [Lasallia pustulata]|uniref:Uncharacterized protein n=1 Tax=Lasallia pustulata TaxID=136370 RepID=A0A5M8PQK2_9LECA|nr:MAG: hypothetical protein FRX48_03959 [Lasallia pustulata]